MALGTRIAWQDYRKDHWPRSDAPLLILGYYPNGETFVDVWRVDATTYDEHRRWGIILTHWAPLGPLPTLWS